jgi:ATP phosphoribosyltransferase
LPVDLIHLTGSVELGPLTGVSEAIVDLVATGRTLQDNGLVAIEDLFHSTARLIGHPLALRLDDGQLQSLVEKLKAVGPGVTAGPTPAATSPVGSLAAGVLAAGVLAAGASA